jgi:dienelactone hydrolase
MKRLASLLLLALLAGPLAAAEPDPFRVLPADKLPDDARLGKPTTLNDTFPMTVSANEDDWAARRRELREQVLVALGLWPLPERTPLNLVVHGKIDRDAYTIEKVFFASYPGHYVSGNLYRPKGKTGKRPGVLCPHGHWANGRFYEANDKEVENQLKLGAEETTEGARYPLQARCAMLARMGCVVFHYDMVGVADSKQIDHRAGFTDADAELRLQSFMGLQTWNSIRALDFLLGLPEVDAQRIGVTGASGGGTQTFLLGAVDDRPAVAFPAVMVSTAMQGGCVCENCSYLRQGAGNVDLAALFAPKPLGMTGAHDWTIDIERLGLPDLRAVYRLYGAEDQVMAKCFPQFPHNYNQVSREVMYNWFNKHLHLGQSEPVVEKPFVPVPPRELSVYDDDHPRPKDAVGAPELRKWLAEVSDRQIEKLRPRAGEDLREYRRIVGTALRVMVHDRLPEAGEVEAKEVGDKEERDGVTFRRLLLGRKGRHEQIPAVGLQGPKFDGTVVVWVHPDGKASLWHEGRLAPAARAIIERGAAILAPDVYWTGEGEARVVQVKLNGKKLAESKAQPQDVETVVQTYLGGAIPAGDFQFLIPARGDAAALRSRLKDLGEVAVRVGGNGAPKMVRIKEIAEVAVHDTMPVNGTYAGYTFGYNRPLLAERVHDVLTAVAFARSHEKTKTVCLAGFEGAGPWVLLARALCGDAVARTAADANEFRFEKVRDVNDPMMLPGAVKYGGLPALAGLCAPGELYVHAARGTGLDGWTQEAYRTMREPGHLERVEEKVAPEKVVAWLLR